VRKKDDYAYYGLREQVEVMHCSDEWPSEGSVPREFAVDPCKDSSPNQVVLARIDRKATLAGTLAEVEQKASAYPSDEWSRELGPNEVLLVPNVRFRIYHRFAELEGQDKLFLNAGFESYWIARAAQMMDFRLDRSGAELRSEAKICCLPEPRYFILDRPFLIVMKKRGAGTPFLVIWVDNAELLSEPR
jgi:hypothetical protein